MQKTTAQSQQESQKTRARLVLLGKPFYKKRTCRHLFNVARPRQRNIYRIRSPTTFKFACIQTRKRTSFEQLFHLDYFTSFEQLIYLGYFIWRRVGWRRDGFLAASWLVGGFSVASWLVTKLPGGETTGYRDKGSRQ